MARVCQVKLGGGSGVHAGSADRARQRGWKRREASADAAANVAALAVLRGWVGGPGRVVEEVAVFLGNFAGYFRHIVFVVTGFTARTHARETCKRSEKAMRVITT